MGINRYMRSVSCVPWIPVNLGLVSHVNRNERMDAADIQLKISGAEGPPHLLESWMLVVARGKHPQRKALADVSFRGEVVT